MFLKAFVWFAGIFTTLAVAIVASLGAVSLVPGVAFEGATMTFPAASELWVALATIVPLAIVAIVGFGATVAAVESIER